MAVTAIINFEISNTFAEWEAEFYTHQSMARQAGLYELYHGCEADNPKKVVVVIRAPSPKAMDEFFQTQGEEVASSGHIIESTRITYYND